jgi:hypothetical protein
MDGLRGVLERGARTVTDPSHRVQIWSETVPLRRLCEPDVLEPLARRGIGLIAAVRPGEYLDARALLAACASHRVRAALWPMLGDIDGRWPSASNVRAFGRMVVALCEACAPERIAIDLEPPVSVVSVLLTGARRGGGRVLGIDRAGAHARFASVVDDLRARGVRASAAVVPVVLFDRPSPHVRGGWQHLLGTPVDGLAWDHVSVMAYTSLFEGWSAGFVRRRDAVELLGAFCALARARYDAHIAGVSLGAVGTGALGNEPVYRSPDELAEDASIARAAGIEALTLFDLSGVLARPPIDDWLDALAFTPPAHRVPAPGARARSAMALGATAARLLAPFAAGGTALDSAASV